MGYFIKLPRISKYIISEVKKIIRASSQLVTVWQQKNYSGFHHYVVSFFMIYNGNWTEWSAIWAEIICMISKSNEHAVWVKFEITSMISDQNCTTWGSITTLLHPFWNHPNIGLGQFEYFIDAVLNWFEITFIHF